MEIKLLSQFCKNKHISEHLVINFTILYFRRCRLLVPAKRQVQRKTDDGLIDEKSKMQCSNLYTEKCQL